MKNIKRAAILISILGATSIAPAFANDTQAITFSYPGNFYCQYSVAGIPATSVSTATVDIGTKDLVVEGFCQGAYVSKPGHISNMPLSEMANTYFSVKPANGEGSGTITINVTNGKGTLQCYEGNGSMDNQFRANSGFC